MSSEPIRFPTAAELEQGFALQVAEDLARRAHPRPRELREQDLREPEAPAPPPPHLPKAFCPTCGKVFDYGTVGMSKLQLKRHQTAAHPESIEGV